MFGEIIKEIQNITTAIKTDRIVVSSIAFIQRAGLISVCLGAVALTIGAVINEYLKPGRYVLSADSALYQHGGWYMTVGGVPYVDMWDVKPPLAFKVPAVLSLLTGGNPTAQLWLSILAMLIGVVAIIWFTATVITDLTGDQVASVLAATVIVAYPFFFYYAAKGFRPKIFVLAIGLGAIYAAMRGHGFGAGVASGSAAGMWQMGIFFIPMIFLILAQGEVNTHSWRSKKQIRNAIVALTTTTVVVVAPIILQGGLVPMLVETIVIPLGEGENQTIAFAIVKGIFLLGFGSISVVVGLVGPPGIIFIYQKSAAPRIIKCLDIHTCRDHILFHSSVY